MGLLLSLLICIVVSVLSTFRYAALTNINLGAIAHRQYCFAFIAGLFFGVSAYFYFQNAGMEAALFIIFAASFVGSSVGLEIDRYMKK